MKLTDEEKARIILDITESMKGKGDYWEDVVNEDVSEG